LKLRWTKRALHQFNDLQDYIAEDNPIAAQAVAQRISDATMLLLREPYSGRLGRIDGTREWVVNRTQYLIAYRIQTETLEVMAVIHSKQSWPSSISGLMGDLEE
jgi:toxin ParE1/3/4